VKRLARIIGVIAGIIAVIWAMRDRFVSVAISREPEPPAFRTHEPPRPLEQKPSPRKSNIAPAPIAADDSSPDANPPAQSDADIKSVKGIGPVFAGRLADAGITDVAQLAATRPEKVAAAAEVALSRAAGWVEAARKMG
jgi:predicted flap endonuclease-1-like 5' DNA nuclease